MLFLVRWELLRITFNIMYLLVGTVTMGCMVEGLLDDNELLHKFLGYVYNALVYENGVISKGVRERLP